MRIAGVVTLYNPDKEVKANILSYLGNLDKLYVIDNTEDQENQKLLPESKKIEYIFNGNNLGVGTALNMGSDMATKEGFEWLLTMDQDSKFGAGQLEILITYITKNKDKVGDIGLISPWHNIKSQNKRPSTSIEEVMEVMTSGNILNLKAYAKVGGFKEWLFIDTIDIEYCMNLNANNYKVIRLNEVELEHELGDIKIKNILGRKLVCSNHNYLRRYYIARNIHYVYDMYYEHFPEYCEFIKKGLKGSFRNVLFFENDKYRKIRNMIRGYIDYKKNVKGKYNYHD